MMTMVSQEDFQAMRMHTAGSFDQGRGYGQGNPNMFQGMNAKLQGMDGGYAPQGGMAFNQMGQVPDAGRGGGKGKGRGKNDDNQQMGVQGPMGNQLIGGQALPGIAALLPAGMSERQAEPPPSWGDTTTIMMRNIPNKYTQRMLLTEVNQVGFLGTFDFLYLPIDPETNANRGYAFFNFIDPSFAWLFKMSYEGRKMNRFNSSKVVSVMPATLQGFDANYTHYSAARVNRGDPAARPLFLREPAQPLMKAGQLKNKGRSQPKSKAKPAPQMTQMAATEIVSPPYPQDGAALDSGAAHSSMPRNCPQCGGNIQGHFQFCPHCGYKVA